MPSPTIEAEQFLDQAITLLVTPTLENLRSVEEALRQAVVSLPADADVGRELARKVRLCGRLLEGAEAARPAGVALGSNYDARGGRARTGVPRLRLDL